MSEILGRIAGFEFVGLPSLPVWMAGAVAALLLVAGVWLVNGLVARWMRSDIRRASPAHSRESGNPESLIEESRPGSPLARG